MNEMPLTPREVLARYHRAMAGRSADDLADLYAADALHTFPFRTPLFPARLEGREAVRALYRAAWGATPVRIAEIHDVVVHEAADPEVVIGEWEGTGTIEPDGRPFRATGLLTLRVRNGEIVDARDYMDVFGTYNAMGRLKDVVAAAESATATG
ncbi:nuclear transport factor 2 family protein [Microbispora hainanensis]|uniref:Nuclear transport factor 2 family protein n=1 Tax=Microbispora hainanensis TaxID=568844 RepID=A0A544YU10_9ACTN|nr:nuclear transport factor 2 family protein [Microbispora hainanensis]TQS20239.1 nuclear transport factor 2 family protein [Microbispora hainanensis]